MKKHSPPPTRFGPQGTVLAKAGAPLQTRASPAPPPTKFGPGTALSGQGSTLQPSRPGTVQTKGAPFIPPIGAPRLQTTPPLARSSNPPSFIAPVPVLYGVRHGTIQKMDSNELDLKTINTKWKSYSKKPYWNEFLAKYSSAVNDFDENTMSTLYNDFILKIPLGNLDKYAESINTEEGVGATSIFYKFLEDNRGTKYHPAGANCVGIRNSLIKLMKKFGIDDVREVGAGGQGGAVRVIANCPSPIDPTWTGSQVIGSNGTVISNLAGFENHHAAILGETVYDPTCGYVGPISDWCVDMEKIREEKTTPTLKATFMGTKTVDKMFAVYRIRKNDIVKVEGAIVYEAPGNRKITRLLTEITPEVIRTLKETMN